MKKLIIAIVAAFAMSLLVAPVASAGQTTVATSSKTYSTKSKNQYWNAVRRLDSDARILGKKSVVEMGVAVCNLLRAGGNLYDLAELVADADPIVEDLLIASIAAAPIYLCRDQQYKFD
jgi:uncharacterized protein YbjQ (UPF0145 family)